MLDKIVKIPTKPGIYFFKDTNNQIIYIGKAKSLRKRVDHILALYKNRSQN